MPGTAIIHLSEAYEINYRLRELSVSRPDVGKATEAAGNAEVS